MEVEQYVDLRPADSLERIYKTLFQEPLRTPRLLSALYRGEINEVRGGDKIETLKRGLERSFGGNFYKALLMGHQGVGKSTELARLEQSVMARFSTVRIGATDELDPGAFKPFDVLLLLISKVAEMTAAPKDRGGAASRPTDSRLKEIWNWFASEETTHTQAARATLELAAGAGLDQDSWWGKVVGLFAHLRGELKYAADRETTVVDYRLRRLSSLIDLANRLLDDCNDKLRQASHREWLVIGDDFEKPGIPPSQVRDLFLTYGNLFKDLRTHLVFTVPVELVFSSSPQLAFPSDRVISIPDTPVYHANHTPHMEGREALHSILRARISDGLLARGQMTRLVIASGGNLHDLFAMIANATENAFQRISKPTQIEPLDVDLSIAQTRVEYERRLGENPYDPRMITYPEKADRLVSIYKGEPNGRVPDPVLYSLLRARAVQEFNGERWFGVHPLVVDILKNQGKIPPSSAGGSADGTS